MQATVPLLIKLLLKLLVREIRTHLRFSLFFVFNLALGLTGLATIDTLKISINEALHARAKGLLAADISVGARRPITTSEVEQLQKLLPKNSVTARTFESYTMVASAANTRLVEVKAIEPSYPFYGEIELSKSGVITGSSTKNLFSGPHAWVYPELLLQLGLKTGDQIKIGAVDFTITDEILRDASGVGAGFTFAPPVYIALDQFAKTGLMQVGSTGYFGILIHLTAAKGPADVSPESETQIENLAKAINTSLTDPAIQIQTSRNASEQVGRLLAYLSDYLGLASLVALFLTALGQIFLYRSYIIKRHRDIAIFKSLGLSDKRILALYLMQIAALGLAALVPTVVFTSLLLPTLSVPVHELLNLDFQMSLNVSTVGLMVLIAVLGGFFICGPLLLGALRIRPRELLTPLETRLSAPVLQLAFAYAPAVLSYYVVSLWLAKSYITGSVFFAIFASAIVILFAVGFAVLSCFSKAKINYLPVRLGVRNLLRSRFSTLASLVTLGLGVCLSNLIPNLEKGIQSEIAMPSGLAQPSLFLVDVQPEQLTGLKSLLTSEKAEVMQTSPMIRARLAKINGEPFMKNDLKGDELTREEENENRARNRGFNLTYRRNLSSSENLVEGTPFGDWTNSSLMPISLEVKFAKRLNVKIGDRLTFDVLGVDVEGQVVNLRKVRWTSFQPNFFIQFDERPEHAILTEAPQTFLVTLGPLSDTAKRDLQVSVVKTFPNVSILDVSRLIERMTSIVGQMSLALKIMAIFSIIVGLMILFSIVSHQVFERRREINLLKIIGAQFGLIQKIFLYEFLFTAGLAVVMGSVLSTLMSYILSVQLFDSAFKIDASDALVLGGALLIICFVIIIAVTYKVLQSRPSMEHST